MTMTNTKGSRTVGDIFIIIIITVICGKWLFGGWGAREIP